MRGFEAQASNAVLDFTGDDDNAMRKKKNLMRWDVKKKKYVKAEQVRISIISKNYFDWGVKLIIMINISSLTNVCKYLLFRMIRKRSRPKVVCGFQHPTKVTATKNGNSEAG